VAIATSPHEVAPGAPLRSLDPRTAYLALWIVAVAVIRVPFEHPTSWHFFDDAVFLAAVGSRLVLDPAAHRYYTAGLVVAVLVWELFGTARRWPVLTLLATALLVVSRVTNFPDHPSALPRLLATAGAVAVAMFAPMAAHSPRARSAP
jgi:hypothetical protein